MVLQAMARKIVQFPRNRFEVNGQWEGEVVLPMCDDLADVFIERTDHGIRDAPPGFRLVKLPASRREIIARNQMDHTG